MKKKTGKKLRRFTAVFLAVLTAVLLPMNAFALIAPPADVPFYDPPNAVPVEPAPWYAEAVTALYYGQGIIWDLMDGEYVHPQKLITRGEFVQLLWNLAYKKRVREPIPEDHLVWAQENGILYGYGNGLFPERTLTREQMATILMRFAKYMDWELLWDESAWDQPAGKFCDAGQISAWAREGADYCARTRLLKGSMRMGGYYDEETGIHACGMVPYFDPKNLLTRAQAIQAVYNYVRAAEIKLTFLNDMPYDM